MENKVVENIDVAGDTHQPEENRPVDAPQQTPLDIIDIVNAHKIIGQVLVRGGNIWQPEEVADISQVWMKLSAFVKSLQEQQGE